MSFEEKIINTNRIYEGNITNYVVKEVELPNGEKASREVVEHGDAVGILALTDDKKAVFVKQYRTPIEHEMYEIPAGLIDENESPLVAAKRELEEETGYQAAEWQKMTSFYTSAGFSNEFMTVYVAENLTKVETPLAQDDDEFIEVYELSYEEATDLYLKNEMPDSKTVVAMLYWQLRQNVGE